MGSEIRQKGRFPIAVEAASEVPITRVDLVRNGSDHLRTEPNSKEVRWNCEDTLTTGRAWYYVRVTQEDGEMAWSSPVWVTAE